MSVPRSGVRQPARTEAESEAIERAILAWAVALRGRYPTCGAPVACGGGCQRIAGHEPPCYCEGVDEDGEETCPA